MPDPRFDGPYSVKAVVKNPGWFCLEHIEEIECGTSAAPREKEYTAATWFRLYGKTSVADSAAKLMILEFTNAGASQATPAMNSTLYVKFTESHTSTSNFNGGEAIYAETVAGSGTGSTGNIGYIAGIQARLTAPAAADLTFGKHYALFVCNNLGASATVGGEVAFIGFRDRGTARTGFFWDSVLVTSVSDGAWETDSGAVGGTLLGYYKVRTAAGAGYIPVYTSHS